MQDTCIYTRGVQSVYVRINRENFINNAQDAINGFEGVWDIYDEMDSPRVLEIVTPELRQQIVQRSSESTSSREKISTLVTTLFETESLENIFAILDVVGLSTIADEICRPLNRQICRTDLPHSRHLQTFYFHLKENIDNNTFMDRREYLQSLSEKLKSSFHRFGNDNDLTKATGRYAVVTWLRIQHCNRDTTLIRTVLQDMYDSWPNGIDKSLCDIFFHSKMAVAATMDGDIESALGECRKAKCLSLPFHDTLTKALISHDSRYTNQRVFMLSRSEENRRLILYESENGLDWLSSDNNGCDLFTRLMKRMFLLYLAQYRLKIQNDLSTDENDDISQNDLKNAKNALFCFDKTMEPNQQMYQTIERLYLRYKAKKLVGEGDFEAAEEALQDMQDPEERQHVRSDKRKASSLDIENEMELFSKQFLLEKVIDPRRAMVYMVCQARICERENNFKMAEFLLNRAYELAQEGAHYTNEMRNIRNFSNRLIIRPIAE